MAGKPGRSGGPRPGSGRKKQPPRLIDPEGAACAEASVDAEAAPREKKDPLPFLLEVMNNPTIDVAQRVRAAIAAAQYVHMKKGDGGVKDERKEKAKKTGAGKFGPSTGPLKLVG